MTTTPQVQVQIHHRARRGSIRTRAIEGVESTHRHRRTPHLGTAYSIHTHKHMPTRWHARADTGLLRTTAPTQHTQDPLRRSAEQAIPESGMAHTRVSQARARNNTHERSLRQAPSLRWAASRNIFAWKSTKSAVMKAEDAGRA